MQAAVQDLRRHTRVTRRPRQRRGFVDQRPAPAARRLVAEQLPGEAGKHPGPGRGRKRPRRRRLEEPDQRHVMVQESGSRRGAERQLDQDVVLARVGQVTSDLEGRPGPSRGREPQRVDRVPRKIRHKLGQLVGSQRRQPQM